MARIMNWKLTKGEIVVGAVTPPPSPTREPGYFAYPRIILPQFHMIEIPFADLKKKQNRKGRKGQKKTPSLNEEPLTWALVASNKKEREQNEGQETKMHINEVFEMDQADFHTHQHEKPRKNRLNVVVHLDDKDSIYYMKRRMEKRMLTLDRKKKKEAKTRCMKQERSEKRQVRV